MTKLEIVERTRLIRKNILKISQKELAQELGSSQAIVSRLELFGKGTIDILIDLINFYQTRGIKIHLIFLPDFNINSLIISDEQSQEEKTTEIVHIVEAVKKDLDTLITKVNTLC